MKRAFASEVAMPDIPTPVTPHSRIWRPHKRYVHTAPRAVGLSGAVSDQFDRGVALTNYGLLAVSIVSLGLAALAALALGRAHAKGAHPITLSHYRFQARIFWVGAISLIWGALTAFVAVVFTVADVWLWVASRWSGLETTVGAWWPPGAREQAAGWLIFAAVLLIVFGVVHTLGASAWGAIKLVRGRPIGHIDG